jgi:replication-associated recombination protein RarA
MYIGPPGRGKNTLAYIFASEYLGRTISLDTENSDEDYIELNASKDRGIDVVRGEIFEFVSTLSNTPGKKRVIFLDEFDSMTKDAQLSLKAIMEKWEHNAIFIMSLNNESGILVPALKSRCAIHRFKSANPEDIAKFFKRVAESEQVYFKDDSIIEEIVQYYRGDFRAILVDCLEYLRGLEHNITGLAGEDDTDVYGVMVGKEDLEHIFAEDTRGYAQRVHRAENPKEKFMSLYRREIFNVRNFLEDYHELIGRQHSKIFAEVDARIRAGGNPMIQLSFLFDVIAK